jgi:hypothetical protein
MRKPEAEKANIERFNLLVGQIMDKLIEACPVPMGFSAEDLGLRAGKWSELDYLPSDDETFLDSALKWLAAEGFIRGENEFVISLKGLELYGRVPNRLKA